ncbi:permease prefix domain 1-containing protein [Pontibacillus salipaludis]|uniref:permease prefix domain 1-containing protein n=1 Tax=Pontibacillus salipaludis TaxID=1697394 RepID=UPI0031E56242
MKQVDEFVDSIYANVDGNEAKELKEEMRAHLVETVAELKANGKTEQEAIDIAINRFGDQNQIKKGLFQLFKVQSKVIKNLFRMSGIALALGLVLLVSILWKEYEVKTVDQTVSSVIMTIEDSSLSEQKTKQITSLVEGKDAIEYFVVYKNPNAPALQEEGEREIAIEYGDTSVKHSEGYGAVVKGDHQDKYRTVAVYESSDKTGLYSISIGSFIVFVVLSLFALILRAKPSR